MLIGRADRKRCLCRCINNSDKRPDEGCLCGPSSEDMFLMTHNTLPSCCVYTKKPRTDAVITARKQEGEEDDDDDGDGVSPKKTVMFPHSPMSTARVPCK